MHFIVGDTLFPASVQDADPFVGKSPNRLVMTYSFFTRLDAEVACGNGEIAFGFDYLRIRGYRFENRAAAIYEFDEPDEYFVEAS